MGEVARNAVEGAIQGARDVGLSAEDAASAAATGAVEAAGQISEAASKSARDAVSGVISGVRVVIQAPLGGEKKE